MTIHIACNIDSNFVKHCAVTLVSIFENNKQHQVCIHIVADNLKKEEQDVLSNLAKKYNNNVFFYFPDPSILQYFNIIAFSKRISMTTYYRCMLSDILPTDLNKVIYLDCDIIVRANLTPFWETKLDNVAIAAVKDVGCDNLSRYEQLGYDMKYSYFNAGVLLINLALWREINIPQQCINFFKKHPERIKFNDQDLLNIVLKDNKLFVEDTWNMQDGFYRNYSYNKEFIVNPMILHFTNRKPWIYDSQHPLRSEYFKYLDLTPWQGWRPWYHPMRFFRLLPFYIGLRKPKYADLSKF